jgi:hypothetical protein
MTTLLFHAEQQQAPRLGEHRLARASLETG